MSDGSIPSRPAMVFSTAKPEYISARFIYNYYRKDEFSLSSSTAVPDGEPPPRYVELSFDPVSKLLKDNTLGIHFNEYIQEIVAQSNKLTSEILLQSSGFIKYTSETERVYDFHLTSPIGAGEEKNKIDSFFENSSVSQGSNFADIPEDTTIYLNPSTNRPSSKSADLYSEQANESLIATDFCFDLIEASSANPFSIHSKKNSADLRDLSYLQARTRRRTNPSILDPSEYVMPVDYLDFENPNLVFGGINFYKGIGIIGYAIFKSRINELGNLEEDMGSIFITGLETSTYQDNDVHYGHRYKYNIHPIYIVKPTIGNYVFAMIGARGKSVKLYTVENVPPPPIDAIVFNYQGNGDVGLMWHMPTQYGNIPTKVVGDIKGYQIFVRDDYNSQFKIAKYITFNDMIGLENFPLQEYVPPSLIHRCLYPLNFYTLNFQKDRDYIVAMCAIDAHGNSSNLSTQYIVRINSATNELHVDFASYKGAPIC